MIKTPEERWGPKEGGTVEKNVPKIADGICEDYKYEVQDEEDRRKRDGIIKRSTLSVDFCNGQPMYSIKTEVENRWEPAQPVFISAQTGKGKNYFVENVLLKYVKDMNYDHGLENRVLILTNRLSLWRQVLKHLGTEIDNEVEEVRVHITKTTATTYQSFFQRIGEFQRAQSIPESQYVYVICDEAHFFASDASFNPHTAEILRKIVETFSSAIRVYMSATPDECVEYIKQQEEATAKRNMIQAHEAWEEECEKTKKLAKRKKYRDEFKHPEECMTIDDWQYIPMVMYFFPRDYSYLDIKIFSEFDELYSVIADSACQKGERWLLFIDDWNKCERVREEIAELMKEKYPDFCSKQGDDMVYAVNADSKAEPRYRKLIEDEKFGSIKILISTSVLDNGVNFKDVHNVVVSTMSPVKCVQMAGRARRTTDDDRKSLYIKRFTEKDINRKINQLEKQRMAYNAFDYGSQGYKFYNEMFAGTQENWINAKRWFGKSLAIDREIEQATKKKRLNSEGRLVPDDSYAKKEIITPSGLYFNKIARALAEEQYDKKLDGQSILDRLLDEFGTDYDPKMENLSNHAELDEFLEKFAASGQEISGEELESFKATVTHLLNSSFGQQNKNRDRVHSFKKINDSLRKYNVNYEIVADKPQKGPWIVRCLAAEQQPIAVDKDSTREH